MTDEDFQSLATRYLEDALEESEVLMLGQELGRYPARVQQFNDLRILTGLIHEHGHNANEPGPQLRQPNSVATADRMRTKWFHLALLGSLVASILLVITFSFGTFAPSPIATLVSVDRQFLLEHGEREVTFIVVRENLPHEYGDVPCHAFAGHRHPEANGPQLELGLAENN